ncbi:MAG TPA: chemotaxis protein CheB [Polyangiaceae bacterium]|nr:chemotaxis protein CheB [Polyangiaceae bacterium]
MQPFIDKVIVMGGSAGALDALGRVLPQLPGNFPLPIAMVLHVPPARPSYLAEVLGAKCALVVKEAEDKEPLAPSTLYVAPPNYHLLVETRRCLSLSVDEPVHFSRPSIDVLFESAAAALGSSAIGVLLTGASADGARGLDRIANAGGVTFVQTPESSSVRVMPEAALRMNPTHRALSPTEIGAALAQLGLAGRDGAEGS